MECQIRYKGIQSGLSYIETLITVTITAILVGGLMGVVGTATDINETVQSDNNLIQQANYAMQRMVSATRRTRKLLLPQNDKAATNWPEHIREQTIPPSIPIGDSTFATAVLAVTLPGDVDLDKDGFADADDDRDNLIDEDPPIDNHHDFSPGIMLIDDDGDGLVDNASDNNINEDITDDSNGDGCPGVCGVDDDSDGTIDEDSINDDDEDGISSDDPYDPVVYYLVGNSLIERIPVPWNEDGINTPDGPVDGRDYIESTIAENVTYFRIERIPSSSNAIQLVDIKLDLTNPNSGDSYSVHTQVRVGSAL